MKCERCKADVTTARLGIYCEDCVIDSNKDETMTKLKDKAGHVLIQVKVPVCITMNLTREDAESMYHRELRQVVEQMLEDSEWHQDRFMAMTLDGRTIHCEYDICPHWDHLPECECELTTWEDGLFPLDDEDDNG